MLPAILSTFGLAFFSFWTAIPLGMALGLHPLAVILTTTLSYTSGVLLMLLAGEAVVALWRRPAPGPDEAAPAREVPALLQRAWQRFGAQGLGLLAPMTVGAHTGALLGMALRIRRWVLLTWMIVGALVWSVLLTLAVRVGALGLGG